MGTPCGSRLSPISTRPLRGRAGSWTRLAPVWRSATSRPSSPPTTCAKVALERADPVACRRGTDSGRRRHGHRGSPALDRRCRHRRRPRPDHGDREVPRREHGRGHGRRRGGVGHAVPRAARCLGRHDLFRPATFVDQARDNYVLALGLGLLFAGLLVLLFLLHLRAAAVAVFSAAVSLLTAVLVLDTPGNRPRRHGSRRTGAGDRGGRPGFGRRRGERRTPAPRTPGCGRGADLGHPGRLPRDASRHGLCHRDRPRRVASLLVVDRLSEALLPPGARRLRGRHTDLDGRRAHRHTSAGLGAAPWRPERPALRWPGRWQRRRPELRDAACGSPRAVMAVLALGRPGRGDRPALPAHVGAPGAPAHLQGVRPRGHLARRARDLPDGHDGHRR